MEIKVDSSHWFLARLLILIKKGGLLQLKLGVVGVGGNIYLWARKVFHVFFPNLLCMLLMTSSQTSSIMAEKKWPTYCDFSSII